MPEQYLAYVDESGDTSLSPQSSPWFFLSACVMRAEEAPNVNAYIEEAKQTIWRNNENPPPRIISWKRLSYPIRTAVLPIFTSKPYTQIIIGLRTHHLNRASENGLQNSDTAYRYACRLLIERISWYVRDNNGEVQITFDQTDRLDLPTLKHYLGTIMRQHDCRIAASVNIDRIRVSSASHVKLLSLADNATSSFASAFNPDRLGNVYPHFAQASLPRLYRHNGNILNYGLKILPNIAPQFFVDYPHVNNWLN